MRPALPIWHCLDYKIRDKLAPMLDDLKSIPPCVWQEWPAIVFTSIVVIDRDKEYIQAHTDAINRILRQAPSRSRG